MVSTYPKNHLMFTNNKSGINIDEIDTTNMAAQDLFKMSSKMRAVTPSSLAPRP